MGIYFLRVPWTSLALKLGRAQLGETVIFEINGCKKIVVQAEHRDVDEHALKLNGAASVVWMGTPLCICCSPPFLTGVPAE